MDDVPRPLSPKGRGCPEQRGRGQRSQQGGREERACLMGHVGLRLGFSSLVMRCPVPIHPLPPVSPCAVVTMVSPVSLAKFLETRTAGFLGPTQWKIRAKRDARQVAATPCHGARLAAPSGRCVALARRPTRPDLTGAPAAERAAVVCSYLRRRRAAKASATSHRMGELPTRRGRPATEQPESSSASGTSRQAPRTASHA